jgi:hypothetical protein
MPAVAAFYEADEIGYRRGGTGQRRREVARNLEQIQIAR